MIQIEIKNDELVRPLTEEELARVEGHPSLIINGVVYYFEKGEDELFKSMLSPPELFRLWNELTEDQKKAIAPKLKEYL